MAVPDHVVGSGEAAEEQDGGDEPDEEGPHPGIPFHACLRVMGSKERRTLFNRSAAPESETKMRSRIVRCCDCELNKET